MDRRIERKRLPPLGIAAIAAGAVVTLLGAWALWAQAGTSRLEVQRQRITVATVERQPFQEYIVVTSEVVPERTFFLETAEGGRVEEILVEEGSAVTAGQPILRLTNTDLQLDILRRDDLYLEQVNNLQNTQLNMAQLRRDYEEQVAELEYQILRQKRVFEQNEELAKDGLVSTLDFEQARDEYRFLTNQLERLKTNEEQDELFRKAQVEQARSAVERSRLNLETAREKLDKLILEAPVDGRLTSLDAEIGESKAPGDRLGQVDVLEGLKIRATIDQHYIARIARDQTGEFEFAGRTHQLRIDKVYPEVQEGTFEADMVFEGQVPEGLKRGQTLQTRLQLGLLEEALVIPRGGFHQRTGGRWIFVVAGDEATRRTLRLGRQNPSYFEVLDGLEAGERVIVSSYESYGEAEKLVLEE